jgi:hypothetical protein
MAAAVTATGAGCDGVNSLLWIGLMGVAGVAGLNAGLSVCDTGPCGAMARLGRAVPPVVCHPDGACSLIVAAAPVAFVFPHPDSSGPLEKTAIAKQKVRMTSPAIRVTLPQVRPFSKSTI